MTKCRHIHFTGSLSLSSAKDVFIKVADIAGDAVTRIPDGETGERGLWIGWQAKKLADNPGLRFMQDDGVTEGHSERYQKRSKLVLAAGVGSDDLHFNDLGYADEALRSYKIFAALKSAGTIGDAVRFQVSLPTPLALVTAFIEPSAQEDVEPALEAGLLRELSAIAQAIPLDQLAIQWDVAVEFGILDAGFPTFIKDQKAGILARLSRLGEAVPAGAELGYHLCYGNMGLKHFIEPSDTGLLVEVANGIFKDVKRPVNWIHLPVPIDRDDEAYFAPLQKLNQPAGAQIFLGLVHSQDGVEGARRRIATASRHLSQFDVASECGLSQHDPIWTEDMLVLHRQVAEITG